MLTIAERAKAIKATRTDFRNVFLQAQVGLPVADRVEFEAVVQSDNNEEAFRQALAHAQLKGWLDDLIDAIVDNHLEDGSITTDISNPATKIELQAMIDEAAGFMQPHLVIRGLDQGYRWTGKITIDKQFRGTGILIANNRLLTAWHVVMELFDVVGTSYEPNPAAGDRLEVIFSDFLQLIGRGTGLPGRGERRLKAHTNWCAFFSSCHAAEIDSGLPQNLEELDGLWDYAIIRLAEPIGFERSWVVPDDRAAVPRGEEKMLLLQHPAGQPIKLGFNDIAVPEAAQKVAIPKLRFLHYVNTLKGSSGGPCFDKSLTFFGFHQGEWIGTARATNRGVPIQRVLDHLRDKYGVQRLEPEESLIWKLGPERGGAPVIGRDDFQQRVLQSLLLGKPRIFTIGGQKGLGKTFLANVVSAMLPNAGHLKVELSAAAISTKNAPDSTKNAPDSTETVTEIANMVCSAAGAGTLQFEPVSDILSTPAVWLKDEVLRKLIEAIDRVRNGRMVWITLIDLNKFDIKNEQITQLLQLIYEQVNNTPWLRIVLDGMKTDIPGLLSDMEYRHRVTEITKVQIETYLRRLLTYMNLNVGDDIFIQYETGRVFKEYEKNLFNHPDEAAKELAVEINKTGETLQNMLKPN